MVKALLWRWNKLMQRVDKWRLADKQFSVISNNCWGGFVYQYYDMPYLSPFAGLFIFAEDYIRFLNDLKGYLREELVFIDPNLSRYRQWASQDPAFGKYPIALLRDIEIHFLHYHSQEEAHEKWVRRVKRINFDDLLIKFSDRDGCTEDMIAQFDKLDFPKKVCLTVKPYPYACCFQMPDSPEPIPKDEWKVFLAHTNLTSFLNDILKSR